MSGDRSLKTLAAIMCYVAAAMLAVNNVLNPIRTAEWWLVLVLLILGLLTTLYARIGVRRES